MNFIQGRTGCMGSVNQAMSYAKLECTQKNLLIRLEELSIQSFYKVRSIMIYKAWCQTRESHTCNLLQKKKELTIVQIQVLDYHLIIIDIFPGNFLLYSLVLF